MTDEERREVARHLRSNANKNEHMPLMLNVAFSAFGFTGCSDTAREAALNIADLIEPNERTCHDFGGVDGTNGESYDFACDACGFCCDLPELNYCPNCGARVVE